MSKRQYKAREKITSKMSKDGLIEQSTSGEKRISNRAEHVNFNATESTHRILEKSHSTAIDRASDKDIKSKQRKRMQSDYQAQQKEAKGSPSYERTHEEARATVYPKEILNNEQQLESNREKSIPLLSNMVHNTDDSLETVDILQKLDRTGTAISVIIQDQGDTMSEQSEQSIKRAIDQSDKPIPIQGKVSKQKRTIASLPNMSRRNSEEIRSKVHKLHHKQNRKHSADVTMRKRRTASGLVNLNLKEASVSGNHQDLKHEPEGQITPILSKNNDSVPDGFSIEPIQNEDKNQINFKGKSPPMPIHFAKIKKHQKAKIHSEGLPNSEVLPNADEYKEDTRDESEVQQAFDLDASTPTGLTDMVTDKSLKTDNKVYNKKPDDNNKDKSSQHHIQSKLEKSTEQRKEIEQQLIQANHMLPKKHKLTFDRSVKEDTGKITYQLRFKTTSKTQAEHIHGSLAEQPVKYSVNAAKQEMHRKISQVEQENVAIEVAHKVEQFGERVSNYMIRQRRSALYRKVKRLEQRYMKKSATVHYQTMLSKNSDWKKHSITRIWQKKKQKRNYAKEAHNKIKAVRTVANITKASVKAIHAMVGVIARHPIAVAVVLGGMLFVFSLVSMMGVFTTSLSSMTAMVEASYLAEDNEVEDVELIYKEWETELLLKVEQTNIHHPGYDEYQFDLDEVGHDPYELMAYLTVVYQGFLLEDRKQDLYQLFQEQYHLQYVSDTKTHTDDDGNSYDTKVLTVTLTVTPLRDIVSGQLDAEQMEYFNLLMDSKGNREYVGSPFPDRNWLSNVTSNYGYRVHPIYGDKRFHAGVDIAYPIGTPICAAQTGVVTYAAYNGGVNSGYGNLVIIENENGLSTRYAHCDTLNVSVGQVVVMGERIATVGTTGGSTGPHVHFEVLHHGETVNPLFFAETGMMVMSEP